MGRAAAHAQAAPDGTQDRHQLGAIQATQASDRGGLQARDGGGQGLLELAGRPEADAVGVIGGQGGDLTAP